MSTIVKRLNKLVSAWGGKGNAHTIEDALENLSNNPPFGSKTEIDEIVPLQSVTGVERNGVYDTDSITVPAGNFKNYTLSINGVTYNGEVRADSEGQYIGNLALATGDSTLDTGEPYIIAVGTNFILWSTDLGETITFSLSMENEIVDYIDGKFLKKVVLYGSNSSDDFTNGSESINAKKNFLYHDYDYTKKVTQPELAEILDSAASVKIEYRDKDEGYNECFVAYVITEFEYWTVGFTSRGFKEFELHTAEYTPPAE